MAHIISSPDPVIYKKLGLDPRIDYKKAAIGVLTQTPSETAIITADLALKAAAIEIGFIDRFSGTLIITGTISDVAIAFEKNFGVHKTGTWIYSLPDHEGIKRLRCVQEISLPAEVET